MASATPASAVGYDGSARSTLGHCHRHRRQNIVASSLSFFLTSPTSLPYPHRSSPQKAATCIFNTSCIFVYIFSVIMLGDPVSPARVAAVVLALGGVGLISAFPGTNNVAADNGGTDDGGSGDDNGDDGGDSVVEKVIGRCVKGVRAAHELSIHTTAPFHQMPPPPDLTPPPPPPPPDLSPPLLATSQYVRTYGRSLLWPL